MPCLRGAREGEKMSQGPTIFDRRLLRARQQRARALGPATFLLDRVAEELAERLTAVLRRFECAVDLGTPTDAVAQALAASGKVATIVAATPDAAQRDASLPRVAADEEALPFAAGSLDLVVSALALQFVNDLPGALIQIRRALKPDGLFLAALLGGDTLAELRSALLEAETAEEGGVSPRVSPFADLADAAALLQRAGFALPVVDSDRITVTYADALALMRIRRLMGETNAAIGRRPGFSRRATLLSAAARYAGAHADQDGRIPATFQVLFLTGWAPAENQQKPLRPGSAATRLADALDVAEHPAGDKAGPGRR